VAVDLLSEKAVVADLLSEKAVAAADPSFGKVAAVADVWVDRDFVHLPGD
jgi:hypothetical protein